MFSTTVLIEDLKHKNLNWLEADYLGKLGGGKPDTNPFIGRKEDWNPGTTDCKSSALAINRYVFYPTHLASDALSRFFYPTASLNAC